MNRSALYRHALPIALLVSGGALAAESAVQAAKPAADPAVAQAQCHTGAYRLDDDRVVDVARTSAAGVLRWRLLDGSTGKLVHKDGAWTSTRGWTDQADGVAVSFGDCAEGRIRYDGHDGRKLKFDVTETRFQGNGVELRGRLVLPPGEGPVPLVVLVHGSENYSGVDLYHLQNLFPANGVGVFVYDKRGTGGSTGKYNQNFYQLSDDAAAALREAKRLAGPRAGRTGFHGGSQGGWVAPLAASKEPQAEFVVVGFGLADGVLAEDRDQVAMDLRAAGFGDAPTLAKAREVSDATGLIASSDGQRGWQELDALRAKYAAQPWWKALKGEYTGQVINSTRAEVLAELAKQDVDLSWDYDPMPVLRSLPAPQLWILGGSDLEAPSDETQKRLVGLAGEGRPITTVLFPQSDHGMLDFEIDAKGERRHTRVAEGYFAMQLDWIKRGKLDGQPYGRSKVLAEAK
ncbi:alpha/beta hydrolase family protein [Lysobacter sp. 1R34A]|uniref:alpha/beta hydrolase family protein n=1 Tax=Lysobacter sp. 1R34A TaxID=3445786 RepID=UPI003EECA79B